ncbi:Phycobilisome degradation protein nblA [Xenococcus sp. PCC 7305]|uniref:NblA/ycf18 family protein n=1 Tax=Xenococcus sp. PCC 7305 TaxID=102125 RepID=UPI0002ACB098|nr:NblA/ycf18 family protein [Xenococcus sp. PCC 7305]ELS01259.1 Phycobilisome degradation protein nblA [Xenococcus sp. PCC 7305]
MDQLISNLSVEQKFSHRVFSDRVQDLSQKQAQDLLVQMHQQMLIKDNLYRELFLSQEKDIVDSLFGSNK